MWIKTMAKYLELVVKYEQFMKAWRCVQDIWYLPQWCPRSWKIHKRIRPPEEESQVKVNIIPDKTEGCIKMRRKIWSFINKLYYVLLEFLLTIWSHRHAKSTGKLHRYSSREQSMPIQTKEMAETRRNINQTGKKKYRFIMNRMVKYWCLFLPDYWVQSQQEERGHWESASRPLSVEQCHQVKQSFLRELSTTSSKVSHSQLPE